MLMIKLQFRRVHTTHFKALAFAEGELLAVLRKVIIPLKDGGFSMVLYDLMETCANEY